MRHRLTNNLVHLQSELQRHCSSNGECGCRKRLDANAPLARSAAARMPLAWSSSTVGLEGVFRDQAIRSQRNLSGDVTPTGPASGPSVEAMLETDDYVFTFAGPVRYPQINPIALLFEPSLELQHIGARIATPFDSGGTAKWFRAKSGKGLPLEPIALVRACEMPVPDFRQYLGDVLAAAFDTPSDYLSDRPGPLCEECLLIEPLSSGCDARRWTFEVRFETRIEMAWSLIAILVPRSLEKERWCFDTIVSFSERGVVHLPYMTSNGETAWNAIRAKSTSFILERLG